MNTNIVLSNELNLKNRLVAHGIVMMFGGVKALDGVDFVVPAGAAIGLLGQNGSGKTTLVNVLTGQLNPQKGVVVIDGVEMTGRPPGHYAKAGVSRVFQSLQIFPRLSVRDNLKVACLSTNNRGSDTHIHVTAQRLGLSGLLNKCAQDISYGHQRLLEIAMSLVSGSTLFFLDEPTAGLEPSLVDYVISCLRELHSDGTSIVVIEHETEFVFRLCSEIYVLNEGCVIARGTPEAIRQDASVLELYLGVPRQ
jgi:ABC-type branched-subunit amino acid transport system ATPase component